MKKFAIPGVWSIVIDTLNDKVYKVMKKGKKGVKVM